MSEEYMAARERLKGIVVLVTHWNRQTERYNLICKHGRTVSGDVTTTSAEDMQAAMQDVYARHQATFPRCRCPEETLIDEWVSLADAQAQYRDDAEKEADPGDIALQRDQRLHAGLLATLGCPSCEPGCLFVAGESDYKARVIHKADCPHPVEQEVDLPLHVVLPVGYTVIDGQRRMN